MSLKKLVGILFIAAILAVFIRMCAFETIRVMTPAMSENQPVGNRLIVEKWSAGARFPFSVGIPFAPETLFGKKSYLSITEYYFRFPGIRKIKRNDLLAFNFPAQDKKKPIDRQPILLSRCIGLPGEYIRTKGVMVYIDDQLIERSPDVCACYSYPINQKESVTALLKIGQINQKTYVEKDSGFIYLTRYQYYDLTKQQLKNAIKLKPRTSSFDQRSALIPFKGFNIELDNRSYKNWAELINRYEGVQLKRTDDGHFKENG
ncbi:MAG: signal peptidase I, partial [Bacteroidales bacterium]|nr:signal peptidase I [Bacteroidales bacterium]